MQSNIKDNTNDLTFREKEILILIFEGQTTKQISQKLFISEFTVKTHRHNLLKKLRAHNTAELIKNALNQNLL